MPQVRRVLGCKPRQTRHLPNENPHPFATLCWDRTHRAVRRGLAVGATASAVHGSGYEDLVVPPPLGAVPSSSRLSFVRFSANAELRSALKVTCGHDSTSTETDLRTRLNLDAN